MERIMNGPCDIRLAMDPKDMNRLFQPGYLPLETGWCHLPNHTAFLAVHTVMPGVTPEMLLWWFAWHPLEDLRYQIWFPPCHYSASVSEADRRSILDPATSAREKIYGKVHYVREDIYGKGNDVPTFNIHFRDPREMGFDPSGLEQPDIACVICAFPTLGVDVPNSGFVSSMVHFARKIEGGLELRSRFFQGYTFQNGKPIAVSSAARPVPEQAPFLLAKHCAEEYANLASFLPQIYAEEKDHWI